MYVYIYVYIYNYIYLYKYIYVYIYIYIYIYIHIYIYIYISDWFNSISIRYGHKLVSLFFYVMKFSIIFCFVFTKFSFSKQYNNLVEFKV